MGSREEREGRGEGAKGSISLPYCASEVAC